MYITKNEDGTLSLHGIVPNANPQPSKTTGLTLGVFSGQVDVPVEINGQVVAVPFKVTAYAPNPQAPQAALDAKAARMMQSRLESAKRLLAANGVK